MPKRHPALYILALATGLFIATAYDNVVHASSFHDYPYQVAPIVYINCTEHWVWYNYSVTHAPLCHDIWSQLTREQLLDAPIF